MTTAAIALVLFSLTHVASAGESGTGASCGADIPGEEQLTAPIVLLGETHGTTEIPAAFAHLVCRAASRRPDQSVVVGLEMASSSQPLIDAYLAGDGSAASRGKVLAHEFWQREFQDGRTSLAMATLLEELRRQRAAGLKLQVRAMDDTGGDLTGRDARMSSAILKAIEETHPVQTLILVGDVHSRILKGYPWDPKAAYEPLGSLLRQAVKETVGLHTLAAGGDAWTCMSGDAAACGPRPWPVRDVGGATPRVVLDAGALDKVGWSGTLYLEKISASRPAKP